VSLIITTEEEKLADALTKNANLRSQITETLLKAKIKASDINNSKFSSSPQFGWFGKEADSYEVVNRVVINIFNENQLRAIADVADNSKAINLSDTEFEHTQKDQFEMQLKQKAIDKVMSQKAFYEKSLSLKLKPTAFRDFDVVQSSSQGANALRERITITGSRIKRSESYSPEPTKQSFDEVEYSASISVDFEVIE
jgi:uncharacterized protein